MQSAILVLIAFNLERATRAMKISFVAQYLERIADHATNKAEMVIYLVEGKIIRHTIPPA